MSNEKHHEVPPPTIVRNEVSLQLTKAVFSPKSDEHKGKTFFTPVLVMPSLDTVDIPTEGGEIKRERILRNVDSLVWFGLDQLIGAANKVARGVFGGIAADNYKNNNGVFNMQQFMEAAVDFTAARESLSNINEELDDLTALQASYTLSDELINSVVSGVWTPEALAIQKEAKEAALKIQALRAKRDSIQAEYERRAVKRKETEAKKEALAGQQKEAAMA